MNHMTLFMRPPALATADLALLARQVAMDLVPREDICSMLSVSDVDMARIEAEPEFAERVRNERRRLLSLEGQRDLAEWKQALTEHRFWDRLMLMAINEQTSSPAIIDAMKVVKRQTKENAAGGGGGGPQFIVNISVPGETPMRVAASVIDNQEDAE